MMCEHCGSTRKRSVCYWPDYATTYSDSGTDLQRPCDEDAYQESLKKDHHSKLKEIMLTFMFVFVLFLIGYSFLGYSFQSTPVVTPFQRY